MSDEPKITITVAEYNRLTTEVGRACAKAYDRGYAAGLDTAREDFAEVNAHKNELLRSVEALQSLLAEARAKVAA